MSTYFNGRIVVVNESRIVTFNENKTKYKSFGEYDCYQFKEIDENLMEDYLNYADREKWNPIISEAYNIKLDYDNDEERKRINEHLVNNAYILSTNDIKRLIEHYEREKQKLEEEIERLDETMRNQQSLASYQKFDCALNSLNEDLSEVNTRIWSLNNFKGMLSVIENCYEEEDFREPCDILNAYLIIVRM